MRNTNFKFKTKVLNRAVSFTVLLMAAGLLLTGCPQKGKEKAKPVYYTVKLEHGGGSLTASPALQDGKALKDSKITFTASPNDPSTHEVDKWEVTGGDVLEGGTDGSTSVKVKITKDTSVKVTFKEKPVYYKVTLVSEGGSLTASPALQDGKALKNSEISFTASPSNPSTHEVDKWELTGGTKLSGGNPGDTSVKVKITKDTTVKVSFKEMPVYYTVTLEDAGGKITASPALQEGKALKDSEISFTASPSNPSTHEVDKWAVTGGQVLEGGTAGSTSVKVKITANTTVSVTFKEKNKYTITYTEPTGGSLTASPSVTSGASVYEGTEITFTASPNDPSTHEVDKWEVTGGDVLEGGTDGSPAAKVKITKDTRVNVTFKEKTKYTVTYTEPTPGSLTASPSITSGASVYEGTEITFTASPNDPSTHKVYEWKVTGGEVLEGGSIGSTSVKVKITADTTISVTFKPIYTVTLLHEGGALSANPPLTSGSSVYEGTEITFTASPNDPSAHEVDKWEVTGGDVLEGGTDGSTSVKVKITKATTVKVTFKEKPGTIPFVQIPKASIAGVNPTYSLPGTESWWKGVFRERRKVILSGYALSKTEVPYWLWKEVYDWAVTNGYTFANKGKEGSRGAEGAGPTEAGKKEPVTMISWRDCIVWCNAYTQKQNNSEAECVYRKSEIDPSVLKNATDEGACKSAYFDKSKKGYRLPTEAEWEYAARWQGTDETNAEKYGEVYLTKLNSASGAKKDWNDAAETGAVAWYVSSSGYKTHPVGEKRANALGLHDMSGNVWEWCWDKHGAIGTVEETDPVGAASGYARVQRGGGFGNKAEYCTVGLRHYDSPGIRYNHLGFRLAYRR